ncbi:MAG: TonB-dependent receptor [Saprospiraceae bacterium]
MKPLLPFLLLLFGAIEIFAATHNGTIKGVVVDADTRAGLPGAHIFLKEYGLSTYSDELGYFLFSDLPSGKVNIEVSYLGYAGTSKSLEISDHETIAITVGLEKADYELPVANIRSRSEEIFQTIAGANLLLDPAANSQELLRNVPGVVIAQHAGGGKAEQIFMRGFDADHGTDVRIDADGLPVNMVSHAHGQGYADLHWLIPEMVEQIEVTKGPFDVSKGDFATAGSINYKTPLALKDNFFFLETGPDNTLRASIATDFFSDSNADRTAYGWLASEYFTTDGYFENPQNFHRYNVMGKYSILRNNQSSASLFFSTFSSRWDASGQIPQRAVNEGLIGRYGAIDPTEGGNTSRHNIQLTTIKNTANEGLLKNRFYFVSYDFELYSNFTFFLNDSINGDQIRQKEKRSIFGISGKYELPLNIPGNALKQETGWDLRFDDIPHSELSHTLDRKTVLENQSLGSIRQTSAGIYEKISWQPFTRLTITGGLRLDVFQFLYEDRMKAEYSEQRARAAIVSPKLTAAWELGSNTSLNLKLARGFHSNDTRVAVRRGGPPTLPTAWAVETGATWKPLPKLLLGAALWQLDLEQEFVYVGDEAVVELSGPSRRRGIDLTLRHQIAQPLQLAIDASWSHGRFRDAPKGENYIPLAPSFTANAALTWKTADGFFSQLTMRHVADRPANENNTLTAAGHTLADLTAGWRWGQLRLQLGVINLTNEQYNEAQFETTSRLKGETAPVTELHFTPGQPRTVKAAIEVLF